MHTPPAGQFTWNTQSTHFLNYTANHTTMTAAPEHDKIAEELSIAAVLRQ